MVEQDYIMRLIKELIRALLKVIFHTDLDMPSVEMLKDAQRRCALEELLNLMDNGEINEAENRLSELLEDGGGEELALALLFYSHLNEKSNDFLEAHDFSREEIKAGLEDALQSQGLSEMAEAFLSEL
ncbi:hypothetical protein B5E77_07335 [Lachnoclostridium sp. An131]|uniref:DUF6483 family protein n=1 Tax=Lachnoclostridium sp. An131 TaxID=1965555 RepID=UPI000B39A95A|nr:DUF6483 family protein [Lachnoclostridium sp. An131]OUQ27346.1 hypothetical protein B5E77_07335 [Lachnoclostridium sp. An131]